MSDPDIEWYINCIIENLKDIDRFVDEPFLTNSMKEIIHLNTNEIEIKIHTIVRKLKEEKTNDNRRIKT